MWIHLNKSLIRLELVEAMTGPRLDWTELCKQLRAKVCVFKFYVMYYLLYTNLLCFSPFRKPIKPCLYYLSYYLYYIFILPAIIGWREKARKIIIYLTDASFHHALDGLKPYYITEAVLTPAGKE